MEYHHDAEKVFQNLTAVDYPTTKFGINENLIVQSLSNREGKG